ncbi:unnamed protein product [Prunus armeniaca]|uniref:Uncharacterized protein n=1 Tax=Prunus armeniaca TaxID=36596 RepID=A0A6J5W776_PRUAR|nr:unnamed protein product [Prunus armeniaca]
MSTGRLYLKPPLGDQKQGSEDPSKASTDQQNSNSSKSPSVSTKTLQPKRKDKGGRGNDFNIVGNNITGIKSERVGIFEFGNTHIYKGHGKEKLVDSGGETDSASSTDEDEAELMTH